MGGILGDIAIGVVVAAAYLAAWVAWLTLGVLPFILAGMLYLAGRYGAPAVIRVSFATVQRTRDNLLHAARQVVPRHASARAARL